jgi:hypothetical protein
VNEQNGLATGDDLAIGWDRRHHIREDCPLCGDPVRTVAILNLVYTFEVCECGAPKYTHLVETLYHRACYQPTPCEGYAPFGRGPSPLTCRRCGRIDRSHPS